MDILIAILCTLCFVALFKILPAIYAHRKFCQQIDKVPGPPSYPLVGSAYVPMRLSSEDRLKWHVEQSFKYKDGFFRLWLGTEASVNIRNPKHLETILPSTVNIKKSIVYDFLGPWLGSGLITSTGEKWFHDRKMITPAFHFNILEHFAVTMFEKSEILLKCIESEMAHNPGAPIDIFELALSCTLDIISETSMGVNINAMTDKKNEYVLAIRRFCDMAVYRLFRPWLSWNWLFQLTPVGWRYKSTIDTIQRLTTEVIARKRQLRKTGTDTVADDEDYDDIGMHKKRKAFLDLLLDASEKEERSMSDKELRDQVNTFMFAGHDTTGAAIAWTLFCLGNYSDVQEKVHEELDEVFGDSTTTATLKDIARLKYLDRVSKESLRLYPSVPGVSRSLVEDIKIEDYTIPKGTVVALSPYLTHRDPDVWKNPLEFDPDRFLPENSKNRHPYAYFPFSAGPRNCIGQKYAQLEEKIVLTAILRKWKVKSVDTPNTVKYHATVILRPSNGILLHFIPKR